MTNESLAQSYLKKASDRLDVLELLLGKGAYSDVVREAQELVELALKGMLRSIGIEPPKVHDVGACCWSIVNDSPKKFEHNWRISRVFQSGCVRSGSWPSMGISISYRLRNIRMRMLTKPSWKPSECFKRPTV